jgi:hypothetical protein
MPVPNAEQTASIFSFAIYSFLDPVVFLAYRVSHLAHDQLPPLADYDYARHLTEKSFPVCVLLETYTLPLITASQYLDSYTGIKKRHLFFGLMRVFRKEYSILTVAIIINVFVSFAGPVGIKQLLGYAIFYHPPSTAEYTDLTVDTSKRMERMRSCVLGSG